MKLTANSISSQFWEINFTGKYFSSISGACFHVLYNSELFYVIWYFAMKKVTKIQMVIENLLWKSDFGTFYSLVLCMSMQKLHTVVWNGHRDYRKSLCYFCLPEFAIGPKGKCCWLEFAVTAIGITFRCRETYV